MNTIISETAKKEINDVVKLLSEETTSSDAPPPYFDDKGYNNMSFPSTAAERPPAKISSTSTSLIVNVQNSPVRGDYSVGPKKVNVYCKTCHSSVRTNIKTTYKCVTHCCCLLLALSALCSLCCCLPYCCMSPEKVVHTCPNCKSLIGTYYG